MTEMIAAYTEVSELSHEENGENVTGEIVSINDITPFMKETTERYRMYVFANKLLHKYLSTHSVQR